MDMRRYDRLRQITALDGYAIDELRPAPTHNVT